MTRQSASNLRKLNGHLKHLALEVEVKVNDARKNYFLEKMISRSGQRSDEGYQPCRQPDFA